MLVLFLVVAALILYGSLYPWQFHHAAPGSNALLILLQSWPRHVGRGDLKEIGINIALYFPLGATGCLALVRRCGRCWAVILPVGAAVVLSGAIEVLQVFEASRDSSMLDLVSNVTGAAVGVLAVALLPRRPLRLDAVVLLVAWAAWQLFPAFPIWRRAQLTQKVAHLSQHHLSWLDVLVSFAGWLALVELLRVALPQTARLRYLAPLLAWIPLRLLVAGRTMSYAELLGAVAAVAVSTIRIGTPRVRTALTAGVAVAAIVLRGLSPFRFQASFTPFVWTPFAVSLNTEWVTAGLVFIEKSFLYASAIWLLRESGQRLLVATSSIAALLALLERLQVHLPGHVPESTDVVMTILIGVALRALSGPHLDR